MAGAAQQPSGANNVLYPVNPDWMQKLPSSLHQVPLSELAIPGSHDSFSFYLDRTSDAGPDTSQAIRELVTMLGGMAKDVIFRWSQTQCLSFKEQLRAGIRYFDLRVASRPGSEDIYFIHCLYGSKAESGLNDIKGYLEEHPKEVVIVDFNHFYAMNESLHKNFMSLIIDIFGAKVCPFMDIKKVSLDYLWQNKYQVIIIYQDDLVKDFTQFWPASSIQSPWANTTDPNKLSAYLDKVFNDVRPTECFFAFQGVLTPDATYIISRFSGSLRNDLAAKADPLFVKWLKKKQRGTNGINICVMDFAHQEGFVTEVIALNK